MLVNGSPHLQLFPEFSLNIRAIHRQRAQTVAHKQNRYQQQMIII